MEEKRRIELVGTLYQPLTIGEPAFIKEGDRIHRTSSVLGITVYPSGDIHFETKNTLYTLRQQ